jgi:hypothetical protein
VFLILEEEILIKKYNNNPFTEYDKKNEFASHNTILTCLNLIKNFSNLKYNIGFWVSSIFTFIQCCSIFIIIFESNKIISQIYRIINSNPPINKSKNQSFVLKNSSLSSSRTIISKKYENINMPIFNNYFNKINSNKKYYKNDNNTVIDEDIIEKILIKKGKTVFSILNPIKNEKYDIDNYNLNDRFIYEYNSIPREIFKVFCEKTPLIRSFFIKYIYEISGMNICCYCFCFLFTFLIQSLLIDEKIIENMRLGINQNKYLLNNSFICFIIYIISFRIISIFFNTSFRIGGLMYELNGEKDKKILFKNKINCFIFRYVLLILINLGLSIFFWIYITIFYTLSIVYQKIWFKYFLLIFLISLIFSIFITLLIVILRNISLSIKNKHLYNSILIIKRLFDYFIPI